MLTGRIFTPEQRGEGRTDSGETVGTETMHWGRLEQFHTESSGLQSAVWEENIFCTLNEINILQIVFISSLAHPFLNYIFVYVL